MIKTRNSQWLSYIYSQICTHTSLKRLPLTYEIQSFQKLGSWLKTSLVNFSTNATRWGVLHLHAKGEKKVTALIYFWIKSENLFKHSAVPTTTQLGSGAARSPGNLRAGPWGRKGCGSPTGSGEQSFCPAQSFQQRLQKAGYCSSKLTTGLARNTLICK